MQGGEIVGTILQSNVSQTLDHRICSKSLDKSMVVVAHVGKIEHELGTLPVVVTELVEGGGKVVAGNGAGGKLLVGVRQHLLDQQLLRRSNVSPRGCHLVFHAAYRYT